MRARGFPRHSDRQGADERVASAVDLGAAKQASQVRQEQPDVEYPIGLEFICASREKCCGAAQTISDTAFRDRWSSQVGDNRQNGDNDIASVLVDDWIGSGQFYLRPDGRQNSV
jgi:hypothetical protein